MNTQAGTIAVRTEIVTRWLDELSRQRALRDEETDILETIIQRRAHSRVYVKWTPALDRKLIRAAHRKSSIRAFAQREGMTAKAAYDRLSKLRLRKAGKAKSTIPDQRFKD
jgi:hypothetical protein